MITVRSNQNMSQYPVNFIKRSNQPSRFLTSLNEKVSKSSTQRAFGRKREVELISQTLLRRKKANPILIGEPGTGKTAIIEEIAHLIVDGKIHEDLQGIEILELDVNALLAGTSTRGAFEERTVELLKELDDLEDNAILFIDEIHQIMNTDGTDKSNGSNTLGELMKPPLVKGTIKCIGATTPDEYSKSFMKNPALNRRFQKIEICEPTASQTLEILQNTSEYFETYHQCKYSDRSLKMCVDIAANYVKYRQFPDKAFDLIDEIGSMHCIDVSNGSRQMTDTIDCEYVVKFATRHLGFDLSHMLNVGNLGALNHQAIKTELKRKIVGQDDTIDQISKCFMRKDCGLRDQRRPIASILLHGLSGIGKSALAEHIANEYNYSLLRLDMSEYMTAMSASSLVGAPPGYTGYEQSGLLTNKIKREPRSIVLFDNLDKAHPFVINLLLQIMEDGFLNDSGGNRISFSNTVIILTLTIDDKNSEDIGFDVGNDDNDNVDLSHLFRPEFMNRLDLTIRMRSLSGEDLRKIAKMYIEATIKRVNAGNSSLDIPSDDDDLKHYVEEILSIDKVSCPRSIQRYVEKLLIDPKINEILENKI